MTVKMSEKHQVTIPKSISVMLGLEKGSLFTVTIKAGHIDLAPVELTEKKFTRKDYERMDKIAALEKGKERRVTKEMIVKMMSGKA